MPEITEVILNTTICIICKLYKNWVRVYSFSVNSLIDVKTSNPPNIIFNNCEGAYMTNNAPIEVPIMELISIGTTKEVISDLKCTVVLYYKIFLYSIRGNLF